MIDFVKATIPVSHEKLTQLRNSVDGFEYSYKTNDDGELLEGEACYRNCTIKSKPDKFGNLITTFEGSLHYWHNFPEINHDDFTFNNGSSTIGNICGLFEVQQEQCEILKLECGLHISVDPPTFIDGCNSYYRNMFDLQKTQQKHITYCKAQRFTLKAYDKNKQRKYYDKRRDRELYNERCKQGVYDIPNLRIEIRAEQKRHLNDMGIYTLADLNNIEKMKVLANDLISKWAGIIFYDNSIDVSKLTTREQLTLTQGRLGDSWKGNTNTVKSRKNRFKQLVIDHSGRDFHGQVLGLIKEKATKLLGVESLSTNKSNFTDFTSINENNPKKKTSPILRGVTNFDNDENFTEITPPESSDPGKQTSPILRNNIDVLSVNLSNKELNQLALSCIGYHNHLTEGELLKSIKQQTRCTNEDQILEQMMNNNIIMYAVPFRDRYCISGSTPF